MAGGHRRYSDELVRRMAADGFGTGEHACSPKQEEQK
jgi:hypothetical protein